VIGKTIETVEQQANGTFFIVQINRRGCEAVTRPDPATVIEAGDRLGLGAVALRLSRLMFGAAGRRPFRPLAR
jgi:Trk K+ transport system NAD-binding subunit